jgi:hypothetical protein
LVVGVAAEPVGLARPIVVRRPRRLRRVVRDERARGPRAVHDDTPGGRRRRCLRRHEREVRSDLHEVAAPSNPGICRAARRSRRPGAAHGSGAARGPRRSGGARGAGVSRRARRLAWSGRHPQSPFRTTTPLHPASAIREATAHAFGSDIALTVMSRRDPCHVAVSTGVRYTPWGVPQATERTALLTPARGDGQRRAPSQATSNCPLRVTTVVARRDLLDRVSRGVTIRLSHDALASGRTITRRTRA